MRQQRYGDWKFSKLFFFAFNLTTKLSLFLVPDASDWLPNYLYLCKVIEKWPLDPFAYSVLEETGARFERSEDRVEADNAWISFWPNCERSGVKRLSIITYDNIFISSFFKTEGKQHIDAITINSSHRLFNVHLSGSANIAKIWHLSLRDESCRSVAHLHSPRERTNHPLSTAAEEEAHRSLTGGDGDCHDGWWWWCDTLWRDGHF